MRTITALVVDDSAFMRKSISLMLESDAEIKVVGTARDGEEGFNLVRKLRPDIITMDIEMPRMDGLTALQRIMAEFPTPVLMISSLTSEGAEATIKALELGAVDFIPKELSYINVNIIKIKEDLIRKVKAIVKERSLFERINRLRKLRGGAPEYKGNRNSVPIVNLLPQGRRIRAAAIGISTGGPLSLQKLVPYLSPELNIPVFIVQHMPPKFTKSLADRLNNLSKLDVKEAEDGEAVKNNTVYIAPGGLHMTVKTNGSGIVSISLSEKPEDTLHKPSVDIMLNSISDFYGKSAVGVIMTGMGRDGLEGIRKLKYSGGYSIAQNEETCVVYGMPKSIVDNNLADLILPLEEIAATINKMVL